MESSVAVQVGDPVLGKVLSSRLGQLTGAEVHPGAARLPADAVVITAASSCALSQCTSLARRGTSVVVLAELPTTADRSRYLAAGAAAYLPMAVDLSPLVAVVTGLLRRPGQARCSKDGLSGPGGG
jgi:DNA-binding response OmpR family regulator